MREKQPTEGEAVSDNPYESPSEKPSQAAESQKRPVPVFRIVLMLLAVVGASMLSRLGKPRSATPPPSTKPIQVQPAPFVAPAPLREIKEAVRVAPRIPEPFTGKVIHVVDGDTVDVLTDGKETIRIRLYGIDCPENGQPFSRNAKRFVNGLCAGQEAKIVPKDVDRYGRTVAEVIVDGQSVNLEVVKVGLAWHYVKYAPDRDDFATAESEAREAVVGLWSGSHKIFPPWEWRKMSKDERDEYR